MLNNNPQPAQNNPTSNGQSSDSSLPTSTFKETNVFTATTNSQDPESLENALAMGRDLSEVYWQASADDTPRLLADIILSGDTSAIIQAMNGLIFDENTRFHWNDELNELARNELIKVAKQIQDVPTDTHELPLMGLSTPLNAGVAVASLSNSRSASTDVATVVENILDDASLSMTSEGAAKQYIEDVRQYVEQLPDQSEIKTPLDSLDGNVSNEPVQTVPKTASSSIQSELVSAHIRTGINGWRSESPLEPIAKSLQDKSLPFEGAQKDAAVKGLKKSISAQRSLLHDSLSDAQQDSLNKIKSVTSEIIKEVTQDNSARTMSNEEVWTRVTDRLKAVNVPAVVMDDLKEEVEKVRAEYEDYFVRGTTACQQRWADIQAGGVQSISKTVEQFGFTPTSQFRESIRRINRAADAVVAYKKAKSAKQHSRALKTLKVIAAKAEGMMDAGLYDAQIAKIESASAAPAPTPTPTPNPTPTPTPTPAPSIDNDAQKAALEDANNELSFILEALRSGASTYGNYPSITDEEKATFSGVERIVLDALNKPRDGATRLSELEQLLTQSPQIVVDDNYTLARDIILDALHHNTWMKILSLEVKSITEGTAEVISSNSKEVEECIAYLLNSGLEEVVSSDFQVLEAIRKAIKADTDVRPAIAQAQQQLAYNYNLEYRSECVIDQLSELHTKIDEYRGYCVDYIDQIKQGKLAEAGTLLSDLTKRNDGWIRERTVEEIRAYREQVTRQDVQSVLELVPDSLKRTSIYDWSAALQATHDKRVAEKEAIAKAAQEEKERLEREKARKSAANSGSQPGTTPPTNPTVASPDPLNTAMHQVANPAKVPTGSGNTTPSQPDPAQGAVSSSGSQTAPEPKTKPSTIYQIMPL